MIDLAQQFLDPLPDLFAVRLQRPNFFGESGRLTPRSRCLLQGCVLFRSQSSYKLYCLLDAQFQTA